MADHIGKRYGDYQLRRLLGRGGFGNVYLGEHVHDKTLAAVKVLTTRLTNEKDLREFINEARTFRLQHPHIVQLLDFGIQDDGTPFLVMAYAPNGTLRQRHPKGTVLSLATIISYVKPIAAALQYAHNKNLIHRDVKPENMLVGAQNQVLLSDFGIAIIVQSTRLPDLQYVAGTVPYMAPEQIQNHPCPASDQYALGAVVYEWLCGERPFKGTEPEIAIGHLSVPPPSLRERVPTIPREVELVVMTALAKDPRQRFGSVQAFATALEQAILGTVPLGPPVPPVPLGPPIPPRKPIKTIRPVRILSSVAGILLLAVLAFLLITRGGTTVSPPNQPTVQVAATHTAQAVATTHAEATATAIAVASMTPLQATATALQAIYTQATSGTPTISDPLTGEDNFNWEMYNGGQGGGGSYGYTCAFTGGAYHSSVEAGGNFNHCLAQATNFSNFALQVQMTIISGPSGGLLSRSNLGQGIFYAFQISTDGTYFLNRISPSSITGKIQTTTLISGSSPAINQGINQSNTLTVVAQRNTFYLYVNGHYVDNASDSTVTSGAIGVFTLGAEAAFSNLKVWKLP